MRHAVHLVKMLYPQKFGNDKAIEIKVGDALVNEIGSFIFDLPVQGKELVVVFEKGLDVFQHAPKRSSFFSRRFYLAGPTRLFYLNHWRRYQSNTEIPRQFFHTHCNMPVRTGGRVHTSLLGN